jgi:hypothetical protein
VEQDECVWRRPNPGQQALLAPEHLRNGDPFTRLAAGFGDGTSTAWRYIREATTLLSAAADDLAAATTRIRRLAYAILDGTLIPIDRIADQKPYYSGKQTARRQRAGHRRPGRTLGLGLTGSARRCSRPDRRPHPRDHRRADQRAGADLCRPRLPRRRRQHPDTVQTAPPQATALTPGESGKPVPCPQPRARRTRHRRPQDLATAQTALLPRRATAIVQAILALHHSENPTHDS